ncbi:MAG: enoyl-CoA hydratase/isomerase family protein [Hyphomicrobiaceae bacterium]|nr:enoyl-CoA hydratase/isomerase family protein [Hyphomicrobiaceae bacterium]
MAEIRLDVTDHIATITIDRPDKLNAMTPEMIETVVAHAAAINRDREIWVVVLRSAGERAFCAGSDIKELDSYGTAWDFRFRPDYTDAVRSIDRPVICAINGYCFGGGLEMALATDIRIASPNASFAAPEVKLGWIGGGGMTTLLAHSIGPSNAALMTMTGNPVDADQALAWGLVSEIVPLERLHERADELARTIASRAPIAAQTAKMNLRAAYSMTREDAVRYERDLQTICFATDDAREGRAAFKSKRPPVFRGR